MSKLSRLRFPTRRRGPALRAVLDTLFRRKKLIFVVFVAVLVVAGSKLALRDKRYESSAQLLVRLEKSSDRPRQEALEAEMALLRSPALAAQVVERLGVDRFSHETAFGGWLPKGIDRWLVGADRSEEREATDRLLRNLTVHPVGESTLLEVRYQAGSPELARDVVAAALKAYRGMHVAALRDTVIAPGVDGQMAPGPLSDLYRSLVVDRRAELRQAKGRLNLAKRELGVDDLAEQKEVAVRQIASLQQQVESARSTVVSDDTDLGLLRAALESGSATAVGDAAKSPVISRLQKEILALELERARLRTLYAAGSRPVRDLSKRMATLEHRVQAERAMVARQKLKARERDQDRLMDRLGWLQGRLAGRQRALDALRGGETRLKELEGRVNESEERLRSAVGALNKEEVADARADYQVAALAVVQPASLPQRPASPAPASLAAYAVLAAVMLSLLAAFVAERCDRSLHGETQAEAFLGLPVLGSIPEGEDLARALGDPDKVSDAYARLADRMSKGASDRTGRLIQVAAVAHGEGASTVAVHLAAALTARDRSRVLLVDANLRRPVLHRLFHRASLAGLSLNETSPTVSGVRVNRLADRNLFVLSNTQERLSVEPCALFASPEFEEFIAEARERFDYVIFDSAPAHPYSDAGSLATLADQTLLVAQAGKSRREVIASAAEALNPTGLILNRRQQPIPTVLYNRL